MTIRIEIDLHPGDGPVDVQLADAMLALGYEKRSPTLREVAVAAHEAGVKIDFSVERANTSTEVIAAHLAEKITGENSHDEVATSAPKRERGQPSPGKARRTKAEIAEDDEVTALAKTCEIFETQLDEAIAEHGHAHVIEKLKVLATEKPAEQPLISTDPENRVGPEDTPEDAAQDAADEAAETAAQRGEDPALTVEDLRNVLGLYVKAYGMANAQVDLPVVLQEVCGEGVVKATDVPEDKIADAIAAIKKTGKENRFAREMAPQVTE